MSCASILVAFKATEDILKSAETCPRQFDAEFQLAILFMSLAFVSLYLVEDDHKETAREQTGSKDAGMLTATIATRNSFRSFSANKQLLTLSLCSAFLTTMYSNTAYLSQAYLLDLGVPPVLMGLFYFVFDLMSSLSAGYSETLFKTFSVAAPLK